MRHADDEPPIGDDFDAAGLLEWYEDEKDGYFSLYGAEATGEGHPYHHVNTQYGYRLLPALQDFGARLPLELVLAMNCSHPGAD